jgi:hypothetical protein
MHAICSPSSREECFRTFGIATVLALLRFGVMMSNREQKRGGFSHFFAWTTETEAIEYLLGSAARGIARADGALGDPDVCFNHDGG